MSNFNRESVRIACASARDNCANQFFIRYNANNKTYRVKGTTLTSVPDVRSHLETLVSSGVGYATGGAFGQSDPARYMRAIKKAAKRASR